MRKLIFLSAILTISFFPCSLNAQDSVEVVIVSKRIGTFIEPAERDYFRIFSDYIKFELAYFTRDSSDAYSVHVDYREEGVLKERKIPVKEISLLTFGERFDNYEKIKEGTYTKGSNPPQLKFIRISKDEINKKLKERQIFNNDYFLVEESDNDYKQFFPHKSWFGFSAGITYTNFNFDEINYLTDKIGNYYVVRGFTVHSYAPDYSAGPFYRFKGVVDIIPNLSVVVMVDENFKSQSIKFDAFSIMGQYNYTDLSEVFIPFAGLGYTWNNFNITIRYDNSLVDSLQGRLQSVTVDGGTEGFITEAGVKIIVTDYFSVGIAANYYLLKAYKHETIFEGISTEIQPGHFGAEACITINF